jgi:hypothetical protein
MMGLFYVFHVINHDFGWAEDLLPPPITALEHFKDGVVGLGRIVPLRNRFMPLRIERLADALISLNAMLAEQQPQLLQRHLHTLLKLWRSRGGA